jgi:RND superfamily putative drug exporter
MAQLLGRLAASAAGHWKRSLAIVAAVLVLIGGASAAGGGAFVDSFSTPGTESQQALDLLTQRFPGQSGDTATLVFATESGSLAGNAAIAKTADTVKRQPHVTGVTPLQLSSDQRVGFLTVQYDQPAPDLQRAPGERLAAVSSIGEDAGLEVSRRGPIGDQAEQLTLVVRSIASMLLTLIASLVALAGGILLLRFGAAFTDFPSFAPTLGVMLGLGAGIDYALLIVGRYREQLVAGDSVEHSAKIANSTAGTSVLAAGAIVVVALAGLLSTGIPFVGRMGIGSAIVVASVAVGAVTVLPTLMGAFAKRLRPKNPATVAPSRAFERWAAFITRRPRAAAAAGTLLLVLLALPVLGLRLGMPDDGNDAKGTTTRVAYDRLAEGFGPGFNGPLVLASSNVKDLDGIKQIAARTPGVAFVSEPMIAPKKDAATLTVIPTTSPQDPKTSDLVTNLRDRLPGTTHVGGAVATLDDMSAKIASRLPIFIALVIGLSIVLLMAVFRSIWVPLVSAAFNLLSIGAAYGVVVLVFQTGMDVPIVSFVPLFMFAILFGLSMDYNVFLQSRIREEYLKGATPEQSVTRALARVGRIILAAGAIMTSVFLGFVGDPDVVVKTIGLGLASAILIDVLIVRMIVAPAVMTLLGDRAWALPAWLDRALPTISLEGEPTPTTA